MMPAAMGSWLEAHPWLVGPFLRRGRRVRTGTIGWFVLLYALSALKPFRRRTLRHARELAHIEGWLALVTAHLAHNYDLAVAIAARRLAGEGLIRYACAGSIEVRPGDRCAPNPCHSERRGGVAGPADQGCPAGRERHGSRRGAQDDRQSLVDLTRLGRAGLRGRYRTVVGALPGLRDFTAGP